MLRPFLSALDKLGADVVGITKSVGLNLEDLKDPDCRVPLEYALALSVEAARRLQDPALGIHVAEMYAPGVFGVLDYWIIDPVQRRVAVLVRDGDVWVESGFVEGQDARGVVLPGFAVAVGNLWAAIADVPEDGAEMPGE